MPDAAHSKRDPYWPRGLSRVQAASYIGVGTSLFDTMMKGRQDRTICMVQNRRHRETSGLLGKAGS
jgi:hypothetical protein